MSTLTKSTNAVHCARARLRRRISDAATRRFVATAQQALPRDGSAARRDARRLIASLARQARKPRSPPAASAAEAANAPEPRLSKVRPGASGAPSSPPSTDENNFQIMKITHPNNRSMARPMGGSIVPFSRRGAYPLNATRPRATSDSKPSLGLRLGHVHLKVRDLARSLPFYLAVLGLRLTERTGRYAFLAAGSEHHALALEEIGAWAAQPPRRAVGIAHFALEVPDRAAFSEMRRRLSEAGVPFISRNNGISWTVRFKDPDGNEIEVYVDRRRSPGGSARWSGRWQGPLVAGEEPSPLPLAA